MKDPNFSESQLQSSVNTAIVLFVHSTLGYLIEPVVPSLIDEYELGWDTGFILPAVIQHPDPMQLGCNIFLQYKLSGLLTGPKAREWNDWKEEYFRFTIPHTKRNSAKVFVDDFHQWTCLKTLADQHYPVYYVTNALLERSELQTAFRSGTLLDLTPVLDVRNVSHGHRHVTFTATSDIFVLHSEKESEHKGTVRSALSVENTETASSLSNSNQKLMETLRSLGDTDSYWTQDLNRIYNVSNALTNVQINHIVVHRQLALFVRRHLGAFMFWRAVNNPMSPPSNE